MHLILQLIHRLKSKNKSSHSKENTTLKDSLRQNGHLRLKMDVFIKNFNNLRFQNGR